MDNDTPDVVRIPLSKQGKNKGKYVAFVSPEDVDLLTFNWCAFTPTKRNVVYAMRSIKNQGIEQSRLLHRVILARVLGRPLESHEQVDHKDGNGLNNTRPNLRLATNSQNAMNRKANSNNQSGYKGVFYNARDKRYTARIRVDGKEKHLGYFLNPEDAHEAYKAAAIKYYGEFANTD